MKKEVYKSDSRGHANYGWLDTHYSFSFAEYYNPERMGFGTLRVLNDDTILGGGGFPFHSHANMEIVTIPLLGALEHKDTGGGSGIIKAGDVQIMSAGSGITHSEFNHSKKDPVSLLQIWITPNETDVSPRYDQQKFSETPKGKWQILVSPKEKKALKLHQRAYISRAHVTKGKMLEYILNENQNGVFLFVIEGTIVIEKEKLGIRDAIGLSQTQKVEIAAKENSEILAIEVPMIPE